MTIPERGTREYEWWSAGAHAEAAARREGRTKAGLDVLSFVDGLAEHWHECDERDIARIVFRVFGFGGQPLRARARLALWVLRNGRGQPIRSPRG
jgi:hypothetical protein